MLRYVAGAMGALLLAGAAQAAALTPTEIVNRHTGAGGDIDKIMADYADDAVVLQAGRAVQGKAEIRKLFERMFPKKPEGAAAAPAGAAPAAPRPEMKVTRVWEEGDVGFMTWEMGPMKTTEEFIVRDGKIQVQALFMSGAPAPAPRPGA
ncbi:MAG: hypothetical protein BGP16_14640 [Sphingobium sp. 66-54]|nr:MAG: hypothetical protein BGP16_14640 [Sphingobium sp. 66-54]